LGNRLGLAVGGSKKSRERCGLEGRLGDDKRLGLRFHLVVAKRYLEL